MIKILFIKQLNLLLVSFLATGSLLAGNIPLAISIRTVVSKNDYRYLADKYSLIFTVFSPWIGGKDLSNENECVMQIKSLNPTRIMLVYGSAINAANVRLRAYRQPQEHPEWFLKNEAGEWVANWEYTNSLQLDPGNTQWREFMAKAYKDNITRYGYDGVFVDIVNTTTHYINNKKASKAVNPKTGKAYTDQEWKEAMLGLLQTVRRHIGDKLMIVNGSRGQEYFQTRYADFLTVADGMCNEGFTGWAQNPTKSKFESEDKWKADVDALADCARRDKIVIAVANVKERESTEPAAAYEARYRYIIASFLLGMGKRHYLQFYARVPGKPAGVYQPGKDVLPAPCNVQLGEPSGTYQQKDGVYQREFQRGKVLVNPTVRQVRVTFRGAWRNDKGETVLSPLVLPAHTGVILLRE